LDQLASQSARFVNGYVPTSVCSPSLATLLTGLYPHQHGIHYNHPPPGNSAFNKMISRSRYEDVRSKGFELIRSQPTLPRVLAEQGYRCLQTGKFWEGHYSNAGFTDGMTRFQPVPRQEFGGNRKLASGESAAHGNGDWGLKIGRETMQPLFDFVDQCGSDQPFLIWYAPYLPHEPHNSPKRFTDLYQGDQNVPEHRRAYYASCSEFDDTVGQLVNYIEKKGLAEDTLFVFVVDNGWTPGDKRSKRGNFQHTKESKRSPFEDGLRTPILLRWDGVISPKEQTGLCSSVDLVPTILDALGLSCRMDSLPGSSLMPASKGEGAWSNQTVFGEIYPGDASVLGDPSKDVAYRWIRDGDLKLIVSHPEDGETAWGNYLKGDALFDLAADPGETNNVINGSKHKKRLSAMRKQLDQWWSLKK
ncbi:sulfatase-like hydrolase/transferase, partial [Verrucomicrobia bacterium]|nr:sulfatase-like hydrolase/transferase [Verrucomicrobiota bacterium]